VWFLFVIGAVSLLRSPGPTVRLWLGWTAAYLLFMLVGRPPFYAPWYLPAMMPGFLLGCAAAASVLAGFVRLRGRHGATTIVLAWLAVSAFVWPRNLAKVRAFRNVMDAVYVPMGRWIRDHSTPQESVFAGDIGYVGWVSERRILDGAGLVSPQVWHFYRDHAGEPAAHVSFVLAERPRFVVASTQSPHFPSWTTPEFNRLYEPVARFQRTDANEVRLGPRSDYTIFSLRAP
jgi:hypothetical protein